MTEFSEVFLLEIPIIDEQHKELFRIINNLEKNILDNLFEDCISDLNEILDYTEFHFKEEEAYFEKFNISFLKGHKVLHEKFILYFNDFSNSIKDDRDNFQKWFDFHGYMIDWLVSHILKEDSRLKSASEK